MSLLSRPVPHLLLLAALMFLGCSSGKEGGDQTSQNPSTDPDPPAECDGSLEAVRAQVFAASCTSSGCHSSADQAAGLVLEGDIAAETVGRASATCGDAVRVVPGSPEQSLLYQKVTAEPPCGQRMPVGGALSDAQIACLAAWIRSVPPGSGATPDGGCTSCDASSDPCTGGGTLCGAACVDTTLETAHCGGCDNACPAGATCEEGVCSCGGGLAACGTDCVDTQTTEAHCGSCGNACATGATCQSGACACAGGLADCGGTCVDLATNVEHCSACGASCPANASCVNSSCVCPGGTEPCGDQCVSTQSDATHCGGCDVACAPGEFCNLGVCSSDCGSLTACGTSCVDTQTDFFHCGGCGATCPAGGSCVSGVCQCPDGTANCGGACISISDPANCGSCGNVCPAGATCPSGTCLCEGGGQVCGSACVDTLTDSTHCGQCGNACGGGSSCEGGVCVCAGTLTLCGGTCVDTTSSATHCGVCNTACKQGETCQAGVCACAGAPVSFASGIQPIFTRDCATAGCHVQIGPVQPPQGNLNLSSGNSYAALVDAPVDECASGVRVKPGDVGASYLMNKLLGVGICGAGTKMPKDGRSLPQADIDRIGSWICRGALND